MDDREIVVVTASRVTPTRVLAVVLATGVLIGVTGSPAKADPAPNLTGTWVGMFTCRDLTPSGKSKVKVSPSTMEISHVSDGEVRMLIDGTWQYNGFAFGLDEDLTQGAATFVECRTDPADPAYNEVIDARVTATPEKGKLKGRSAWGIPGVSGNCKYAFKRTSTADPVVDPCTDLPSNPEPCEVNPSDPICNPPAPRPGRATLELDDNPPRRP